MLYDGKEIQSEVNNHKSPGKFPNIQKLNNIFLNNRRLKKKSQDKLESILSKIKLKQNTLNMQNVIKAVQRWKIIVLKL